MNIKELVQTGDLDQLVELADSGNGEASFTLAVLALQGRIVSANRSTIEYATDMLYRSAIFGYLPARIYLNKLCQDSYNNSFSHIDVTSNSPLVDFDGNVIEINKTGVKTPVDAVLMFKDGRNILKLTVDLKLNIEQDEKGELGNVDLFCNALRSGICDWAGTYTVFGGQLLEVVLDVTIGENSDDNIEIVPVTSKMKRAFKMIYDQDDFESDAQKDFLDGIANTYRSFAQIAGTWNTESKKKIFINTRDLEDYSRIRSIMKHEFGHVLGLGDLYKNDGDGFTGVNEGSFKELDDFYIGDNVYNLVMCDSAGPISNNDIEMVVLAFESEEMQLYQKQNAKDTISKALGRGN